MIVPETWIEVQEFLFYTIFLRRVYIFAVWKLRIYFLVGTDWIFALATCAELVVARPCALASAMNFAWAQGKVTLLVLRVFHVEAFTISPLCHHLNYLTASLIHTSAAPFWSGRLHCKLHTFWEMINYKEKCEKQLPGRLENVEQGFYLYSNLEPRFFHRQKVQTCFHTF